MRFWSGFYETTWASYGQVQGSCARLTERSTDCVGDGGPGRELAESAAGAGAARRGGLRPVPCRTLASDAVDEVRRAEQRRLGAKAAKTLKGSRFCLLKHPARLKPGEKRRLTALRRQNRALDRAYELKEYLAIILEQASPAEAPDMLDQWLAWAARSRLAPLRQAGTDGPQARSRHPGLPRHEDDQRARGRLQQQAAGNRPPRLRLPLSTARSSRCCFSAAAASNWPRPYPHAFEETPKRRPDRHDWRRRTGVPARAPPREVSSKGIDNGRADQFPPEWHVSLPLFLKARRPRRLLPARPGRRPRAAGLRGSAPSRFRWLRRGIRWSNSGRSPRRESRWWSRSCC